jgi:hypothetical protein
MSTWTEKSAPSPINLVRYVNNRQHPPKNPTRERYMKCIGGVKFITMNQWVWSSESKKYEKCSMLDARNVRLMMKGLAIEAHKNGNMDEFSTIMRGLRRFNQIKDFSSAEIVDVSDESLSKSQLKRRRRREAKEDAALAGKVDSLIASFKDCDMK